MEVNALAPIWQRELEREGLTGPSMAARVAVWLATHPEDPSPERVEMLTRRVRGQTTVGVLAREYQVAHSRVQAWLRDTSLRLIVPRLDDVAAWTQARTGGIADEAIAVLSGTRAEVVALALDGWPPSRAATEDAIVEASRLWRAGAPRTSVAQALGVGRERLVQQLRTGESVLTPRRLYRADLITKFGWDPSSVGRYRRQGILPVADGRDGNRSWWWEPTITRWEARQNLLWCPSCQRSFVGKRGLNTHNTKCH